jgi:hypothetical protein
MGTTVCAGILTNKTHAFWTLYHQGIHCLNENW